MEHDIALLTPTLVACVPASSGQKKPWHDEACSRPGSTPFLAKLQPTPGGQHYLVQLQWKGGHPCLGSRLTFDPKHAPLHSCLHLGPSWPVHDLNILLVQKMLPCQVLYGAGYCLGRRQSYVQTPPSPMATFAEYHQNGPQIGQFSILPFSQTWPC